MNKLNNWDKFRLKTMAKYAKGKVLDIWFNQYSNPYLNNIDWIDIKIDYKPNNYNNVYLLNDDYTYPIQDNIYDTIIAWEVIEHILNLEWFFNEINRVLKKKWRLIISTPNPIFYSYIIFWIFNLFPKNCNRWDHVHLFCMWDIYTLSNIYWYNLIEIKSAYWQFLWFKLPIKFDFLKFLSFQLIYILEKKD